mmetsp:Transcript_58175/g.127551  ORF Transcript_58175/g.127551 Transcript_58175/m.127551 type:complete len:349 (-) Transcript_58175:60-1106(-)
MTLAVRRHDQRSKPDGHVDNSVTEIQLFCCVVGDIPNSNDIILLQCHICVLPGNRAVHQRSKNHRTVTTTSGELGAVFRPRDGKNGAGHGGLSTIRPSSLVAQLNCVVRSDCEVPAIGRPSDSGHHVLQGSTRELQTAIRIPNLVLAILAPGEDEVGDRTPVNLKHHSVVSLPLGLLLTGLDGLETDLLLGSEQDVLTVGGPSHTVDRVGQLGNCGPQHPTSRPNLQCPVLPRRGQSGAIIVPPAADHSTSVSIHLLLFSSRSRNQAEGTIGAGQRERVRLPFATRYPVHVRAIGIDSADLPFVRPLDVPLLDGLVIRAGEELVLFVGVLAPPHGCDHGSVLVRAFLR